MYKRLRDKNHLRLVVLRTARHPRQRRVYGSMRREYHMPSMINDVYNTLNISFACTSYSSRKRLKRETQLFSSTRPLEFVSTDILLTLSRTMNINQYVIVMTHQYTKHTRAISVGMITATHVAKLFFESWILSYRILTTYRRTSVFS